MACISGHTYDVMKVKMNRQTTMTGRWSTPSCDAILLWRLVYSHTAGGGGQAAHITWTLLLFPYLVQKQNNARWTRINAAHISTGSDTFASPSELPTISWTRMARWRVAPLHLAICGHIESTITDGSDFQAVWSQQAAILTTKEFTVHGQMKELSKMMNNTETPHLQKARQ